MTSPPRESGRVRALMVTGAYHPEISSGGLQCQLMAGALADRIDMQVLTTSVDPRLPRHSVIDGVPVSRVLVDVGSFASKLRASPVILAELVRLVRWCDVVHLHGVSTKNVFVTATAQLLGKPVVLSLHTTGADEPGPVRSSGALAWWAFRSAARYLGVSPGLVQSYLDDGLPANRIREVPNGIDTNRFAPATVAERSALRRALGLAIDRPLILFVGFFSEDKQPRVLFDAWLRMRRAPLDPTLVFVGATKSAYLEVDDRLADRMRVDAKAMGVSDRVVFAGTTHEIENYFRAADVFALPSQREGLPVALLEAMSCGLPCVASRLPGATDAIIQDGGNGRLVPPGDVGAFADALTEVLTRPEQAAALGSAARATVMARFASTEIADRWIDNYRDVIR